MQQVFNHIIEPLKLAATNEIIEATLSLDKMTRLNDNLISGNNDVFVSLNFYTDNNKLCVIKGSVKVNVNVECKRCLDETGIVIESDFIFSPVADLDQANNLPPEYEPVLFLESNKSMVDLLQSIEDELILSLPLVPMHPESNKNCTKSLEPYSNKEELVSINPFGELQKIFK